MGVKKGRSGCSSVFFVFFIIHLIFIFVGMFTKVFYPNGVPSRNGYSVESDDESETVASQSFGGTGYSSNTIKKKNGRYELTSPVMDVANIIEENERISLENYLLDLDRTTGVQIVVFTVPSLEGEDIASFSMKYAQMWQLGQKGVDNGVLLTVAYDEHDVRIETGYGTEGALTDAKCARILRNVIIPAFKSGDYTSGIVDGVKNIAGVITEDETLISPAVQKALNAQDDEEDDSYDFKPGLVFVIWLVIFMFLFRVRRKRFYTGYSPYRYGGFSTGSFSSGGSSFGHSSGGSSFRGGGGSFGGGGASGKW